jgi:hypothetical protein
MIRTRLGLSLGFKGGGVCLIVGIWSFLSCTKFILLEVFLCGVCGDKATL